MSIEKLQLKEADMELIPTRLQKQGVVQRQIVDGLLWIGGMLPADDKGNLLYTGRVGAEFSVEEGYKAARLCGLNVLRQIVDAVGSLDRVDYAVKATVCVSAVKGFGDIYKVADGFSDVLTEALGERGLHARNAVGASTLQGNAPVVCDLFVKLRD